MFKHSNSISRADFFHGLVYTLADPLFAYRMILSNFFKRFIVEKSSHYENVFQRRELGLKD
jgi:hypothetical protein